MRLQIKNFSFADFLRVTATTSSPGPFPKAREKALGTRLSLQVAIMEYSKWRIWIFEVDLMVTKHSSGVLVQFERSRPVALLFLLC